jgi:hypothetical protein
VHRLIQQSLRTVREFYASSKTAPQAFINILKRVTFVYYGSKDMHEKNVCQPILALGMCYQERMNVCLSASAYFSFGNLF